MTTVMGKDGPPICESPGMNMTVASLEESLCQMAKSQIDHVLGFHVQRIRIQWSGAV